MGGHGLRDGGPFRIRLAQFVTWLDPTRMRQRLHPPRGGTTVLVVACILLLTAITAAHQLTPFAAFPMLVAMLLIGRCRLPILPVLALVLPVLWLLFVATPYLVGHLDRVFGSIGDIGAIASASVIDRVSGSWGHQLVVYIRLGETAAIWGLAVLGAVVGRVRRTTWLAAAAGLTAPFVLVPAQSYGGELLMRIYYLSGCPSPPV